MRRSRRNKSLLALLTTAITACGDSSGVAQSSDSGESEASLASDTGAGGPSVSDGAQGQGTGDGAQGDAQGQNATDGSMADAVGGDAAVDATGGEARDAASSTEGGCPSNWMQSGDGGCVPITVRRPFLVGSSMRSAVATPRGDWSRALTRPALEPNAATAEALAQTWLKDALEEHASVAAFARFTMLLLAVGAPPELVASSQRASIDEIHHARACFALAERYGRQARGPSPLSVHDAIRPMSLAEIAALTAEEGCVGETLGAALATEQLALATDSEVTRILGKIAADEARHAQLAWRFAKWAATQGGREVRQAIAQAAERAIASTLAMEVRSYEGIDVDTWHSHGRLTCAEARASASRTIRRVVRPCLALVVRSDAACAMSWGSPGAKPEAPVLHG